MYFNVKFNEFFKLIKVLLLVSELYSLPLSHVCQYLNSSVNRKLFSSNGSYVPFQSGPIKVTVKIP